MRAWQVIGAGEPAEVMKEAEVALAPPPSGQLAIRVVASALGLPDVLMCRGEYRHAPSVPFTLGQEFVGIVTAAGPDTSTPVGAKVMGVSAFFEGAGAFAEFCLAPECAVYPVPEGMDDASAAAFTIGYHTAHVGLVRRAGLRAGKTVLVHGASGGTGGAAVRLAKAYGATVLATAGGADKAQACLDQGADIVIDYNETDFVAAVRAATDGRGVDIVYDPVGGETFERSIECTAAEGCLIPIGFASGRWGVVPSNDLTRRNISIIGALPAGFPREQMLAMHTELGALFRQDKLRAPIDRQIRFADIRDGLQAIADREVKGRIVAFNTEPDGA